MLKRYQVLINDWLADYIKKAADKNDLSFSEVIRLCLCLELGINISKKYPKFKYSISDKEVAKFKSGSFSNLDSKELEERHRFISKIYFEARKAVEFATNEQKKESKKSKG